MATTSHTGLPTPSRPSFPPLLPTPSGDIHQTLTTWLGHACLTGPDKMSCSCSCRMPACSSARLQVAGTRVTLCRAAVGIPGIPRTIGQTINRLLCICQCTCLLAPTVNTNSCGLYAPLPNTILANIRNFMNF